MYEKVFGWRFTSCRLLGPLCGAFAVCMKKCCGSWRWGSNYLPKIEQLSCSTDIFWFAVEKLLTWPFTSNGVLWGPWGSTVTQQLYFVIQCTKGGDLEYGTGFTLGGLHSLAQTYWGQRMAVRRGHRRGLSGGWRAFQLYAASNRNTTSATQLHD
jgi:hypothetical protein